MNRLLLLMAAFYGVAVAEAQSLKPLYVPPRDLCPALDRRP